MRKSGMTKFDYRFEGINMYSI